MALQIETLRPYLNGQWIRILSALSPELAPAIARIGKHVACPVHGGRDGFRLFKDADETGGGVCNTCGVFRDGFELLSWLYGWSFYQSIEAIGQVLGIQSHQTVPTPMRCRKATAWKRIKQKEDKALIDRLNQVWDQTMTLSDPQANPARLYLHRRGITTKHQQEWDRVLRFHPNLPYYDEDGRWVANYPALIGKVVTSKGLSATFHRIYITDGGLKAPVDQAKKMMPVPSHHSIAGGGIPIGNSQEILGVAEGIETALAVFEATGQTCWSAVNATLLARFEPPKNVKMLYIWADHDRSKAGLNAAQDLSVRVRQKGIATEILVPPIPIHIDGKSWDWNDVLNSYSALGFPQVPK